MSDDVTRQGGPMSTDDETPRRERRDDETQTAFTLRVIREEARAEQRAADIKVLEALRPVLFGSVRVDVLDRAIAALRSGTPTKEAQDE